MENIKNAKLEMFCGVMGAEKTTSLIKKGRVMKKKEIVFVSTSIDTRRQNQNYIETRHTNVIEKLREPCQTVNNLHEVEIDESTTTIFIDEGQFFEGQTINNKFTKRSHERLYIPTLYFLFVLDLSVKIASLNTSSIGQVWIEPAKLYMTFMTEFNKKCENHNCDNTAYYNAHIHDSVEPRQKDKKRIFLFHKEFIKNNRNKEIVQKHASWFCKLYEESLTEDENLEHESDVLIIFPDSNQDELSKKGSIKDNIIKPGGSEQYKSICTKCWLQLSQTN
jgi:thymidine kinase